MRADRLAPQGFNRLDGILWREIMEELDATRLIEGLASGVDPLTGEVLDADNPCQHPDVVRALCLAARALDERRQRLERQKALPANVGKPWSNDEDALLTEAFHAGKKLGDLALEHQRTAAGIQARLEKLGLVEATAPRARFGSSRHR
jgi:hypothetical protein